MGVAAPHHREPIPVGLNSFFECDIAVAVTGDPRDLRRLAGAHPEVVIQSLT